MLKLFLVIGNLLTGLFDQTEFKMIVVLFAEVETLRLGFAALCVAGFRQVRYGFAFGRSLSFWLMMLGGSCGSGFLISGHLCNPPRRCLRELELTLGVTRNLSVSAR